MVNQLPADDNFIVSGRGKPDTSKTGCNKPGLPAEPERADANETLLVNMKQMIDGQFDSNISTALKREIMAALQPFEKKIDSHAGLSPTNQNILY